MANRSEADMPKDEAVNHNDEGASVEVEADAPTRPGIRWWPLVLILLASTIVLVNTWMQEDQQRQAKVLATLVVLMVDTILLFVWLVLLSRLRPKVRLRAFVIGIVVAAAVGASVRIEQVSGDIVPILAWRWTPKHDQTLDRTTTEGDAAIEVRQLEGAADLTQFLGDNRDATFGGPRLARDWSADPPRELWRIPVGAGWSSFTVKGGRAYTQEQRGDLEMVTCYELASGRPLWTHGDATRFDTTIGGIGPRGTPTLANGRIYTMGATGVLNCLDAVTGTSIWRHDLRAEYDAPQVEWGFAGSPLVVDGKVIVNAGAPNGRSLMAFDAETGELAWAAGDDEASYASPTVRNLAGVRQIIMFNQASVTGHDIETGKVLWTTPWQEEFPKVAQPLVVGESNDLLFYSSAYGAGATVYRFSKNADGELTHEKVWKNNRMKAKFSNMIPHDGAVYGFDDGIFACVDIETGRRRWKGGRYGHGQVLKIGDVFVLQAENGRVVMLAIDPDEHRELTSFQAFDAKTWNSPAIAGRYLIVRNDREAVCYELPIIDTAE